MRSRRTPAAVLIALLLILGCGSPQSDGNETRRGEDDFAHFANRLYDELGAQPIDSDHPVEIGLFGNLDVMSGENVVMGRYRYRVDTLRGRPAGHLAFHIRDVEAGHAMPVILTFRPDGGDWHLANARHIGAATPPRDSSHVDRSNALTQTLRTGLESWAEAAVERTRD